MERLYWRERGSALGCWHGWKRILRRASLLLIPVLVGYVGIYAALRAESLINIYHDEVWTPKTWDLYTVESYSWTVYYGPDYREWRAGEVKFMTDEVSRSFWESEKGGMGRAVAGLWWPAIEAEIGLHRLFIPRVAILPVWCDCE